MSEIWGKISVCWRKAQRDEPGARELAAGLNKRYQTDRFRAYQCEHCGFWHAGRIHAKKLVDKPPTQEQA
jgi:rubrerythrin